MRWDIGIPSGRSAIRNSHWLGAEREHLVDHGDEDSLGLDPPCCICSPTCFDRIFFWICLPGDFDRKLCIAYSVLLVELQDTRAPMGHARDVSELRRNDV